MVEVWRLLAFAPRIEHLVPGSAKALGGFFPRKVARPTAVEHVVTWGLEHRTLGLISSGVVEGLNNKAKVTMRKSYGFHAYRVLELALYHTLGKLPEPECAHDFF